MKPRPLSTSSLHSYLLDYLSNEDIYQICSEIGLDYEDFVTIGGGRSYTLLRLLNYYRRRSARMPQLLAGIHTVRPDIDLVDYGGQPADPEAASPASEEADGSEIGEDRPTAPHYENFDLLVSTAGMRGRYFINARHTYAGGAGSYQIQDLDLESETFKQLARYLENLVARQEDMKAFGEILHDFLFPPRIAQLFFNLYETMLAQGRGVRVRLSIQPPELVRLPWEYCYNADRDFFPAKNIESPWVRLIQQPYTPETLVADGVMRILVVLSNPNDVPQLDIDAEEGLIRQALEGSPFKTDLLVLREPTGPLLYQTVDRYDPHVLHFVGHGRYRNGQGSLVIHRADGSSRLLSAEQLADILHNRKTRIVILNACESATADEDSPAFNSVAQALVHRRMPAVVAMQFKVPDRMALVFAEAIYRQILSGDPLDRAVTEMRIQASVGEHPSDQVLWGIPVLFMRASDGQIWKRLPAGITPPTNLIGTPPITSTSNGSTHRGDEGAAVDQNVLLAEIGQLLPRVEFIRLERESWEDVMEASKDIRAEIGGSDQNLARIRRKMRDIAEILTESQVGLIEAARIQNLLGQLDQLT